MKFQAPTSKLQRSPKRQAPNPAARCEFIFPRNFLEFEVWNFSGAWMLVLGAF
jgi:hypothetical protein